ncbi:hypothetical protein T07_14466 [Trichinella nelsoni]|uniref:Uncharacterized protein n=1 Tax=Trichinella nelsoni TaxID=6336 RepID=A0A0V0S966_9BILA|nr:hypothetical protein T07_14466 [Trichinella nelsoni]
MQGSLFQIFINLLFTVANKCKLHLLLTYKNTVWKWRKSYVHSLQHKWMNGNEWVITPSVTLGGSQCGKNFHGFFMLGPFFMEGLFFMEGSFFMEGLFFMEGPFFMEGLFFMEGPFLPAKRNFGIGF